MARMVHSILKHSNSSSIILQQLCNSISSISSSSSSNRNIIVISSNNRDNQTPGHSSNSTSNTSSNNHNNTSRLSFSILKRSLDKAIYQQGLLSTRLFMVVRPSSHTLRLAMQDNRRARKGLIQHI